MDDNSFQTAQLIAAYKRLFLANRDGKAVLEDMAADGMLDRSTFDPNPYIAGYNAGRRDQVLGIFQKLNVNLVEYLSQNVNLEDF